MADVQPTPLLPLRVQQLFPIITGFLAVVGLSSVADVLVNAFGSNAVGMDFRFRFIGMILAAGPQLALLLAISAGFCALSGYRVGLRAISVIGLIVGAALVVLIFPFGLDFLHSRHLVPDAQVHAFTMAGMKTAAFAGLFGLFAVWLGWAGFQASKKTDTAQLRSKGEGLVVGQ